MNLLDPHQQAFAELQQHRPPASQHGPTSVFPSERDVLIVLPARISNRQWGDDSAVLRGMARRHCWCRADTISNLIPRPEMTPRWPHEIIAHDLREAIADGTYPVGSPVPMNEDIRVKYKVATGTVSRAVHQLRDEGLLRVVSGKRPKVIAAPPPAT